MLAVVTGFEPFNGASINESWEAVKKLPEKIGPHCTVHKVLLPVTYEGAPVKVRELIEEWDPDVLIHVGLSAQAPAIMLETTARNKQHATIPDNAGVMRDDAVIDPHGPDQRSSTWDAPQLAATLASQGFPVQTSDDAGLFVCNTTLYTALRYAPLGCITGFIHVPPQDVVAPSTVASTIAGLLQLL